MSSHSTNAPHEPRNEVGRPAEKVALFPGSFDPFTIGHASIVRRALTLFDRVVQLAPEYSQRSFFTPAERVEAIRRLYAHEPRVEVEAYDDLTADLALRVGARFVLRGIRSVKDFEYERDLAGINHRLSDVETVLLFTEPQYADISSTVVRELLSFGKDVSAFLPETPNNSPLT